MRIWKKVLSVMLVGVMLAVSVPVIGVDELFSIRAASETVYVQGIWHYKIVDDYSVLVGITPQYNGNANTIIAMPDKLGGYPVKVIQSVNLLEAGIQCKCKFVVAHGVETISAWAFNSSNMSSIVIPCTVKSIGQSAFANCKFTALYYGGTEEQYNDISFGFGALYYPINFYGAKIYYNHNEYYEAYHTNSSDDEKTKFFPNGYNFEEDSYSFGNYYGITNEKYFTTIYEEASGKQLHKYMGTIQGGLCYGMAYTTAAFFNGLPDASFILNESLFGDSDYCSNLREAKRYSKITIGNNTITINDYIKYAFVYQWAKEEESTVWGDSLGKSMVNSIENDKLATVISFHTKEDGDHAVLAVGYEEKEDETIIYVDDPNSVGNLEKIVFKEDGSWEFSNPWGGKVNSFNSMLGVQDDVHMPYKILLTGEKATLKDAFFETTNALPEDMPAYETYIEGMERLNADKVLLTVKGSNFEIQNDDYYKVPSTIGAVEETVAEEECRMYWVNDDKTVTVSGFTDESNEVALAGDNTIITANVTAGSTVEMTIDEEDINANIATEQGEEYSVTVETIITDEYYENVETEVSISGTASGSEITATQTDTGLVITGIEDGTITLTQDDEVVATKRVTNAKGDVEITYDAEGETTDLGATYEHDHTDYDHNGKCDTCVEVLEAVKNCTCMCHKSGFMALVYAFVNLFWRVFGTHKSCECGVWHW